MKTTTKTNVLATGLALALLALAVRTEGATIEVGGGCTLVAAIEAANTDAPVDTCSAGAPGRDILELTADVLLTDRDNFLNGWNGLPQIASPITIEGNGHSIARAEAADGFRILYVLASGDLSLRDVEIRNGLPGAITNEGSTSTWNTSLLDNDEATHGGGLESVGTAVIVNTTISGNSATLRGAGISNTHFLWLIDSIVTDNLGDTSNSYGGALANWNGGDARIVRTTISGNFAGIGGGGISNGDDSHRRATLEVVESTIANNSTGFDFDYYDDAGGGGIMNDGGFVAVRNSTLSGNLATGNLVGSCPGEVQLTVSGAQPGAEVAFMTSDGIGVFEKPLTPCEGLELYLNTQSLATVRIADANGIVIASPDLADSTCGWFFQVVDKAACSAAPVARLPRPGDAATPNS